LERRGKRGRGECQGVASSQMIQFVGVRRVKNPGEERSVGRLRRRGWSPRGRREKNISKGDHGE